MADSIQMRVTRYIKPGPGFRTDGSQVRGAAEEGLGDPRRAELHQGPHRREPVVSLVVPDGHLRQLRDEIDGEPTDLSRLPHRLHLGRFGSSR